MRNEFHAELDEVRRLLVAMADEVRGQMNRATTALLTADLPLADSVRTGDDAVDQLYQEVEEKIYDVLARQSPVATDLRMVVTALHCATGLERMGDLAEHVARTARRRHPNAAVPAELATIMTEMAEVADRIAGKISRVLAEPDATRAAELETDDDVMDDLHRQLFALMLSPDWPYGVEAAVDGALLGRFYERFADHAVNAGHQMYFLVTGEQLI
jgi:phosphate transport system protein